MWAWGGFLPHSRIFTSRITYMLVAKVEEIIKQIEKQSIRPIENRALFGRYVLESLNQNIPVTFYNWECPPRRISKAKNGAEFIDYNINLKNIFAGKRMDVYTELPRVIERRMEEIKILTFLRELDFPCRFVKLVADTNAYYLTPESLRITGKENILKKFSEFKILITQQVSSYPLKTNVRLFTELMSPFADTYKNVYGTSLKILRREPKSLLSKDLLREQKVRTRQHIGIKNQSWNVGFSFRTISTYAAEGVVLSLLSDTKDFSNCVWLNNHEIDERTIKITNCYRRKIGLADLPMVFGG